MSLSEIRNVVLLFSNPVWSGGSTIPTTIIRNVSSHSSQLAYEERIKSNITTLTTNNADTLNGVIQGLLYVPDLKSDPDCKREQLDFLPQNITHRDDLPPANYNIIAFAPWFSIECTKAYLKAARKDPIRAFIFYKPNNSSNKPQDANSPVWNLEDGDAWKRMNPFPIFAVSGREGQKISEELGKYSGNVTEIPHADEIQKLYGPNPRDYVRIWTELTMEQHSSGPALWAYFLIVIGALLLIFGCVSFFMHMVQRRRRQSLEKRVKDGHVDLEAMGIKRVLVPEDHVKGLPLFTYQSDPEISSAPPTPGTAGNTTSSRASRQARKAARRAAESDAVSQHGARSIRSMRSKRSSLAGDFDATATNHQPKCMICLDTFEHRVSVIRELSCGHIFHPECIDEYLIRNSSLCPVCKQNMLPLGYSPKITNAMVRRERALRRLRQSVEMDDSGSETGHAKFTFFGKGFFRSTPPDEDEEVKYVPMTPVKQPKTIPDSPQEAPAALHRINSTSTPEVPEQTTTPVEVQRMTDTPTTEDTGSPAPSEPPAARRSRPTRSKTRARALRILPTQPEDEVAKPKQAVGRKSPSQFARQRMRELAHRNAPIDDEGQAKWRNMVHKVFPGFS